MSLSNKPLTRPLKREISSSCKRQRWLKDRLRNMIISALQPVWKAVSCKLDTLKAVFNFYISCLLEKSYAISGSRNGFYTKAGISLSFIKFRHITKEGFNLRTKVWIESSESCSTIECEKWILIAKMAFVRNTESVEKGRWVLGVEGFDDEGDLDKRFGWAWKKSSEMIS